jgi:N-acetylglucosamine kinase-like BadF-type ATPase
MTRLFLGIDAGNSKTAVLACLASGKVVGAGRSGCGDIYGAAGEESAVREVLGAVGTALAEAGATRADVAHAAFRLAGIDWPEDLRFWDGTLSRRWPGLSRTILNDGYAAIRCGEMSGVGVAVNAGTAAAIAARGPDGAMWDMGWWGQHAMGAIGLVNEALKAAFLAHLGAAPPTALGRALVGFYGVPDLAELNRWFTRRHDPAPASERPRAARIVTDAARAGDQVARRIVDEQGRRLAFYAQIAARHAGLLGTGPAATGADPASSGASPPISVVMSGSVLADPDSPVAAALRDHLTRTMPSANLRPARLPPAAGAALDALAEAGVPVTPGAGERLAATIPPPSFFQT